MRFHTLVAVSAAVGTLANTNLEAAERGNEATASTIEIQDQSPPALVAAGSTTNLPVPSTRKVSVQIGHSRRDDDDDGDDGDDDDSDDGKPAYRPHTATIAGATIGGVVLILLLLVLWLWFKFRAKRQRRRRQQRDKKNEEGEEEDGNYAEYQGQHQHRHLMVTRNSPPCYEQLSYTARDGPRAAPHATTFPVELPTPVDNLVTSAARPEYEGGYRVSQPHNPASHPVDQPNPAY